MQRKLLGESAWGMRTPVKSLHVVSGAPESSGTIALYVSAQQRIQQEAK